MKTCTKCGEEKPATTEFFYKTNNYLRNACKECTREYKNKWCEDNKEHIAERNKQYKKDNKERVAEYNKQHYEDNKERYAERHKQWEENNQEKRYAYTAKRRATKLKVTTENFTRQDVLDKWGTDCHICSDPVDLNDWHMDHVVPLQPKEGEPGEHTLANVKPSHPHCNISKGNKRSVSHSNGLEHRR